MVFKSVMVRKIDAFLNFIVIINIYIYQEYAYYKVMVIAVTPLQRADDRYFHIPGSSMPPALIQTPEGMLRLGLVEVGCRPRGKGRQLRKKRNLIGKWTRKKRDAREAHWSLHIYRTRIHFRDFDDTNPKPLSYGDSSLDANIQYSGIPDGLVARISDEDRERIDRRSTKIVCPELDKLISQRDGEGLYKIITRSNDGPYRGVRGILGEIIAHSDLKRLRPSNMKVFGPQDTTLTNNDYDAGTEFDGVLVFHSPKAYCQLLWDLGKQDYLTVYANTNS